MAKRKLKVLFLGSKNAGYKCLEKMIDVSKGRDIIGALTTYDIGDTRSAFAKIKEICERNKIPLHVVKHRKEADEVIFRLAPDLCIVVCWYYLIPKKIIDFIGDGIYGIHFSLLPKYRGGSPLVWSLINGEAEVGLSLFRITEGMDNGEIISQKKVSITQRDYVGEVSTNLEDLSVSVIEKFYPLLLASKAKGDIQDEKQATYCAQRIPDDGLIDWNQPAKKIHDFIRAQSIPYPGAFTHYSGKKLTVWRSRLIEVTYYGTYGQVCKVTKDGVWIVCGDNKPIILERVQIEREQEKEANEVIKSIFTRFE